jgi:5-methylthioadenosine/S-adenosylhomocysteine deaminase
MAALLISHGTVLTVDLHDTIIDDGAVLITDERIADVGPYREVAERHPGVPELDAGGMVVMPGLINTHVHLAMTMLRGIADDVYATDWLPAMWTVEERLQPETVYAGALVGIAEMIASGTTCFNDHYFYMDQVAKAVTETGIRAHLAHAILQQRSARRGQQEFEKGRQFAAEWNGKAGGRISTRMGPHSLYSCSTPLIVQARQTANELGIGMHMHVAESAFEMKLVGKHKAGETSVQHLEALGVLRSDFVLAHGLTINQKDMEIVARRGVGIAHSPQAYAKVGGWPFPSVDRWIKAGINVGMATDGVSSNNNLDLFDEMRFATLTRKLYAKDGRVLPASQLIRMATIMAAKVLGVDHEIGSLETGKRADVILIDFRKPHLTPRHNIPGHLVYSASGADVDTVFVNGQMLMRNRQFLMLDLPETLARGQREFEALLNRTGWKATSSDPKQGLMGALRLKMTGQALKVVQTLATGRGEWQAEDEAEAVIAPEQES